MMVLRKYLNCLLLTLAVAATVITETHAQDVPKELYAAAGIPDSLKEDANSVIRYSNDEIAIKGPGQAVIKHHSLVTILNEKGDDEALLEYAYNKKYATYNFIDVHVYDANGLVLKKYHRGDFYDGGIQEDGILIQDDRFFELKHTVASYPTTIEVEYEEDLSGFIELNQWRVQNKEQSIQNETYNISVKPDLGFRYKCKNISLNPEKVTTDGLETYKWKTSNRKAFKLEKGSVNWRVLPEIEFAINKFDFFGYPGDLSTWQNFGKWQQVLNADVCNLTPQRAAEIQQMTANIKTDKEKAEFLYKYMQKDMRYVAIGLGIGGLKPFPAMFVDQKKYGDCKAFSNYMCALLKAVNIPAYYAIIEGGTNGEPSDPSFPYDISNHIIVCIPFKGDTTWLECTNRNMPFGQLGPFTENRNALIITEDGGKLVNTPKSKTEENQFNSEVHIVLDNDGGAKAQVKILGTGEYRELWMELPQIKEDQRKEFLLNYFDFKQPSVFNIQPGDDKDGTKEMDMNLEYDKFCDIASGDKQFYHPQVFALWNTTVPVQDKRKTDYYFDFPSQRTCVTTIDLPAGFEVETLPASQQLKFTYGDYDAKYVYDAAKNQVIITTKFDLNNHVIPAAKYTEMQQYMDAVAKAQNKKLVIHHKA